MPATCLLPCFSRPLGETERKSTMHHGSDDGETAAQGQLGLASATNGHTDASAVENHAGSAMVLMPGLACTCTPFGATSSISSPEPQPMPLMPHARGRTVSAVHPQAEKELGFEDRTRRPAVDTERHCVILEYVVHIVMSLERAKWTVPSARRTAGILLSEALAGRCTLASGTPPCE